MRAVAAAGLFAIAVLATPAQAQEIFDEFLPAPGAGPGGVGNAEVLNQAAGRYPIVNRPSLPLGQLQKAWNDATPAPGQIGPGVLRVPYRPNRAIVVRTREFMTTVVYLSPWETIDNWYLGDDIAFKASFNPARPNVIRVRPVYAGADTDLVAITASGRVVTFYLRSEGFNTPEVTDLTVFVDMPALPSPAELVEVAQLEPPPPVTPSGAAPDYLRRIPFDINELRFGDYRIRVARSEDRQIAPERVFHDGLYTYIDFGDKADVMVRPVVHQVIDEIDTPVNTNTAGPEGNILVVQAVGNFTLRAGAQVVCIDFVDRGDGTVLTAGRRGANGDAR